MSCLYLSVCLRSGDLCSTSVFPVVTSTDLEYRVVVDLLYKKETHKVGWYDCFSAVLIIKGSLIHNIKGRSAGVCLCWGEYYSNH